MFSINTSKLNEWILFNLRIWFNHENVCYLMIFTERLEECFWWSNLGSSWASRAHQEKTMQDFVNSRCLSSSKPTNIPNKSSIYFLPTNKLLSPFSPLTSFYFTYIRRRKTSYTHPRHFFIKLKIVCLLLRKKGHFFIIF